MKIYIDITELASNPVRSGIQRVVRELVGRLRRNDNYVCCFFHPEALNLMTLNDEVVDILIEQESVHRSASVEELKLLVADCMRRNPGKFLPHKGIKIFIPEVFYEINRVRHYRWRLQHSQDIYMLFYDFIPWLYPELIGVKQAAPLMPYLLLSSEVSKIAFISESSRSVWRKRILRDEGRSGIVLPLGADGLGLERLTFDADKRSIVCLESIDGRKNQDVIARAFLPIINEGIDLRLVIIGYASDKNLSSFKTIEELASRYPQIEYIEGTPNDRVMSELRRARATIYGSAMEGFGLPPVEGLHSGIPAIAADDLPSIASLPSAGQIRLRVVEEDVVEQALRLVARDDVAAGLWKDCASLQLPTWEGFVQEAQAWIES